MTWQAIFTRPYVQVHSSDNTGKISAFSAFQPGMAKVRRYRLTRVDRT
jgi:hypothetical protein